MRRLLSTRLTRRLLGVTALGSLADWMAFSALVALVVSRTQGSAFAVAIVACARLLPALVLGPLVAPYAGVLGIRRTLVAAEAGRAAALLVVAASAGSSGGVAVVALIVALACMELAAALSSATRESVISTKVSPSRFATLNAATGILSYGMLPVGGVLAALLLRIDPLAPFAAGVLLCAVVAWTHGRTRELDASTRAARSDVRAVAGLRRVAAPGRLRDVVVVAAFGTAGIVMLFSVGTRVAETAFGSATDYGFLLGLLGLGAVVGAVAAQRHVPATGGLLLAAASAPLVLGPRWVAAAGVLLIGAGAGVAYVATQAALQRAARSPEEFAAAFAVLKAAMATSLLLAPAVYGRGGVPAVVAGVVVASMLAVRRSAAAVDEVPLGTLLLRAVVGSVLRVACRIEVLGRVPAGGAVLASNHPNALDGPLGVLLDRRIRAVAKPQRHPLARFAFRATGTIVTGRGAAMDAAVDHLRAGGMIWIAPEGRVNPGPVLAPARTGAARIAAAAQVPLIPLAVTGTAGLRLRAWRPWRRPHVTLRLGSPIQVSPTTAPAEATASVMRVLGDMLGMPFAESGTTPAAAA